MDRLTGVPTQSKLRNYVRVVCVVRRCEEQTQAGEREGVQDHVQTAPPLTHHIDFPPPPWLGVNDPSTMINLPPTSR